MKCPACQAKDLREVMTRQGVAVDTCDACHGVWLDRGEIFLLAKKPAEVERKLKQGIGDSLKQGARQSGKTCPRSGEPLREFQYPAGPKLDVSLKSGGLWFDAEELKALLEAEKGVKLEIDANMTTPPLASGLSLTEPSEPVQPSAVEPTPATRVDSEAGRRGMPGEPASPPERKTDSLDAKRKARIAAGLVPLPNLFLRSASTLIGLYTLLGLALIAAVEFGKFPLEGAVGIGVAVVIGQFLLGPFIMDLTMRWLYRMEWVTEGQLPEHLRSFVKRICAVRGIGFPSFGIINDGAPQAFTYGHTPGNARIVISRGLFDLLEEKEVEAVVAHEIGHAVHWDMLLMTIAQLVPLLLYYIYRAILRTSSGKGGGKGKGQLILIGIGAYILFIISEYVVLWFSRTREYHADRFAGSVTGDPSLLASGLVKIAYGLAGQDKKKDGKEGKEGKERSSNMEAIGALGIFDNKAAQSMAIAGYSEGAEKTGQVSQENIKGAMRWDLWNPWAKWYELNSTHPLVAKRLQHLSDQAVHMGKAPYVVFDYVQPESYWDEFFVDLAIHLLPVIVLILTGLGWLSGFAGGTPIAFTSSSIGLVVLLFGLALLFRFMFVYRGGFFPAMSVASLLKKVKVSAVRPVPCSLKGRIIGRGVPGLIFSEDFVMKDDTGIMFLDYRQPLRIMEFFFGLMRAGRYEGMDVVAEGWYRRSPVPYVELLRIRSGRDFSSCSVAFFYKLLSVALIVIGAFLMMA